MKCPKCHYIGFDKTARCRNCGYDFSLALPATEEPDLPIRDSSAIDGPLSDFVIEDDPPPRRTPDKRAPRLAFDLERLNVRAPVASRDLPLFQAAQAPADDAPLIAPGALPRAPLAVRRRTPDSARLRDRQERHSLDEPPLELDVPEPVHERLSAPDSPPPEPKAPDTGTSGGAASPARIAAGLLDGALLLAIDAAVVSFTLQVSGLTTDEMGLLPLAPLLGFFAILNGGYLLAFTAAGGQTIGKMIAGIRVVSRERRRVTLGQAAIRTGSYLLSATPAGAGFLAAFFSADGRALHDRLAGTQVVPAARADR
jgi:uncharacterized RDD family membrane protein YckC